MINLLATAMVVGILAWGLLETWLDWRKRKLRVYTERADPKRRAGARLSDLQPRGVSGPAKTSGVLIALVVALLGWEGFALTGLAGQSATISEVYWNAREGFPLDLLLGVLFGHLTWQRKKCKVCGQKPS